MKVRQNGRIVAVSVNGDSRREILGLDIGPSEVETIWIHSARIEAPFVIDGPINGKSFLAYVEQMMVNPCDIVIIDNLGSHKSKAVRCAIRAAGAKLICRLTGLSQAQDFAAQGRRANRRSDLATYRSAAFSLQPGRMR